MVTLASLFMVKLYGSHMSRRLPGKSVWCSSSLNQTSGGDTDGASVEWKKIERNWICKLKFRMSFEHRIRKVWQKKLLFYQLDAKTILLGWKQVRNSSFLHWDANEFQIRHNSVESSAPTILQPWVRVPSIPSVLLSFIVFVLYFSCEENKNKSKRGRIWHRHRHKILQHLPLTHH